MLLTGLVPWSPISLSMALLYRMDYLYQLEIKTISHKYVLKLILWTQLKNCFNGESFSYSLKLLHAFKQLSHIGDSYTFPNLISSLWLSLDYKFCLRILNIYFLEHSIPKTSSVHCTNEAMDSILWWWTLVYLGWLLSTSGP